MKRIISILICLATIFALTACGQEKAEQKTIEITLPASFMREDGNPSDQLTKEQKKDGFLSAKDNKDDTITYTIGKEDWEKLLAGKRAELETNLQNTVGNEKTPSIKNITYNDDFTEIIVDVDQKSYESHKDNFFDLAISFSVSYYQTFAQMEPGSTISLRNVDTKEVFDTLVIPEK